MKKAIFKISILFLTPILLTIPYTSAYFSSQAISKENTFMSGSLSIKDPGQIISDNEFNNLFPGWQDNKTIKLHNDGTLNFKCKMSICCDEDSILYNGDTCLKVTIIEGNKFYCEDKKINGIKDIVLGEIDSGASRTLKFEFSLPNEADNNYSDKSCNLRFVFDAVQEDAPFVFNVDQGDSIQNAINSASEGDIINIGQGVYNESLKINKSLTINGDILGITKITYKPDINCNEVINMKSGTKNVSFSNIEVDAGKNYDKRCLTLENNNNNISFNNMTFSNGACSIWATDNAKNVSFKNTSFENNAKCCIHLNDRMQISNIIFSNCSFSRSLFRIPAISGKGAIINNFQFDNCSFKNVDQYY